MFPGSHQLFSVYSTHQASPDVSTFMRDISLSLVFLVASSYCGWAIYGPSLTRADVSVAVAACREANFTRGAEITKALHNHGPDQILQVFGDGLREWRATAQTSALYPARAFCIHELVPRDLIPPQVDPDTARQPPPAVARFHGLGILYRYYEPDGGWVLVKDPVDLEDLATNYLGSRWGREAFLLMTRLGWSRGECREGPDQFRAVIKHGESFLKDYPESEVSDGVRMELANAYATWWNVSRDKPKPPYSSPEPYKAGAEEAKQRAIKLYQDYLKRQKTPAKDVQDRLKALQENPKGSNEYDYFCEGYED